MKTRHSYGIMLFRINPKTEKPELFLMQRRCTYAFMSFAHGDYNVHFNNRANLIVYVQKLFNGMTLTELEFIRSLNFDFIWMHMWKHYIDSSESIKKLKIVSLNHFNRLLNIIGKDSFINLIQMVSIPNELWWEPPKGKQKKGENKYVTAIREFEEETGISKSKYIIIPQYEFKYSYIDEGTNYVITYFMGIANKSLNSFVNKSGSVITSNIIDKYTEGCAFKFMENGTYKNLLYSVSRKLLYNKIMCATLIFSYYRRYRPLIKFDVFASEFSKKNKFNAFAIPFKPLKAQSCQ